MSHTYTFVALMKKDAGADRDVEKTEMSKNGFGGSSEEVQTQTDLERCSFTGWLKFGLQVAIFRPGFCPVPPQRSISLMTLVDAWLRCR